MKTFTHSVRLKTEQKFITRYRQFLKKINDTQGHAAGDEFIKKAAKLLCNIFAHSPVFRIGGDEFVVFLAGNDFANRNNLINCLRSIAISGVKNVVI